jgi:hypothetical protein
MFASMLEALHELSNGVWLVPLRLISRSKLESIHDVVPTPFLTDAAGGEWKYDMPLECTAPVEVPASVYFSAGVRRLLTTRSLR